MKLHQYSNTFLNTILLIEIFFDYKLKFIHKIKINCPLIRYLYLEKFLLNLIYQKFI